MAKQSQPNETETEQTTPAPKKAGVPDLIVSILTIFFSAWALIIVLASLLGKAVNQ